MATTQLTDKEEAVLAVFKRWSKHKLSANDIFEKLRSNPLFKDANAVGRTAESLVRMSLITGHPKVTIIVPRRFEIAKPPSTPNAPRINKVHLS